MIGKLKKLKGKSLAEIKDRGRQASNVFAERFGVSPQAALPTDAKFLQKFDLPEGNNSAHSLFNHFKSRESVKFYSSFDDRDATIGKLRSRFPEEESAIINRADRICDGFFDLLGHQNLYFESKIPNWHFEPISRKTSPKVHWSLIDETDASPTGDKKVVWELNRHQYFATLGRAYWLTGEEKYAETCFDHLENWFDNNPPKIGVNWLSSLEIAFRSLSWIWGFHFFRDSPSFRSDVFLRMLKYLYSNGRHLETYLSTHFSPNTHLTGEALGLYFLGTFLPELRDSRRWKSLGYKILMDALDFQVRADGVYCEQSSAYHRYTTDFYSNLMILRRLDGEKIEQQHCEKLNGLFDFLLHITQPNGETPLFGDDDGGRFYFLDESSFADFRPTLALGAVLLKRGDLKFVAKSPTAELLWLLGCDGLAEYDRLESSEPAETAIAFKPSGFFSARNSWAEDSNFVLIDCGEHGFLNGGHAHADALGFVLTIGGEPIFVDSGTYNYTSDPEARTIFRSSSAHNCLTVNGCSSSVADGSFSWKSMAEAKLLEWSDEGSLVRFRGVHNGFQPFNVHYEREIIFERNGPIVLNDAISSDSENSYELNFILSPHIDALVGNNSIKIFTTKDVRQVLVEIQTELSAGLEIGKGGWVIEDWSVSPRYGSRIKTRKLVYSVRGKGKIRISTRIVNVQSAGENREQ